MKLLRRAVLAATAALALALPAAASADTMAVQPDGKIVVVGALPGAGAQGIASAVIRFGSDGRLDPSFGAGGAIVDFRAPIYRGWVSYPVAGHPYATPSEGAIAVQPDGKILVAQRTTHRIVDGFTLTWGLTLFRYLPDGRPDMTFGTNGVVNVTEANSGGEGREPGPAVEKPVAILVRPDGSIALVSDFAGSNRYSQINSSAVVAVFNPAGVRVSDSGVGTSFAEDAILSPAGGGGVITAGGYVQPAWAPKTVPSLTLARTLPEMGPHLDPAFGEGDGVVKPTFLPGALEAGFAAAVLFQEGKLLTVGQQPGGPGEPARMLLARFAPNGVPDPTFGEGGATRVPLVGPGLLDPTDATAAPGGKVFVTGTGEAGAQGFAVARFAADGEPDPSFGSNGLATASGPPEVGLYPTPLSVAALPDGKVLVNGRSTAVGTAFLAARFNAGGTPDPSFGSGGMATWQPCVGTTHERRESGCFSSAAAGLNLVARHSARPAVRLRIAPSAATDPLTMVRLRWPKQLGKLHGKRLRFAVEGATVERPKVHGHTVTLSGSELPLGSEIALQRGFFRWMTRGHRPAHRLSFQVEVRFLDGSMQTIGISR